MTTPITTQSKIGDIRLSLSNIPPAGFISITSGTVLLRSDYSELWDWVQSSCTLVDDDTWVAMESTNGSCPYFSSGNTIDTFRLPKISVKDILSVNASNLVSVSDHTPIYMYIRYTSDNQETLDTVSLTDILSAINSLYERVDSIEHAYDVSSNLSANGWQVYSNGTIEQWGVTPKGATSGTIVFPLSLASDIKPLYIDYSYVNPNSNGSCACMTISNVTNTSFDFTSNNILPNDAYFMWTLKAKQ